MKTGTRFKKKICATLLLSLLAVSCGARDNPDSVYSVETSSGQSRQENEAESVAESSVEASDGMVAVADFYYMEMDSSIDPNKIIAQSYAVNSEWLYVTDCLEGWKQPEEQDGQLQWEGWHFGITRKRIADGYQEQNYIETGVEMLGGNHKPYLLADREGNCYIFWQLYDYKEETTSYALEKYGPDGELLWRTEPDSGQFEGVGERLEPGTVTGDGRVILYSYGAGGSVFCFGAEGGLEAVYQPKLQSLEGVAAGKDGSVYGYCVTGKERMFEKLGDAGEQYACPMTPLAVYDGYEEGVLLRTGEGMYACVPETGETRRLWGWADEYLQVKPDSLDKVCQEGGAYTLLCGISALYSRQILDFARVTFKDSADYPGRQRITLTTDFYTDMTAFIVRMYNRQSREYRVEIAAAGGFEELQMQLVRGEGADLMDVGRIPTGDLTRQGAFEDLDPWYERSSAVGKADILESVLEAGIKGGKNVTVIPMFYLNTLRFRADFDIADGFTVWKFLELGEENRMFSTQSPGLALGYCMGKHGYGDRFIDWENKSCSFDGEEFRRILESCGKWETCVEYSSDGYEDYNGHGEGEWILESCSISSPGNLAAMNPESSWFIYDGEDYLSALAGYPGWDGGEYLMSVYNAFAINSSSKNKEGAWDFLEYLLSEEFQSIIGPLQNEFPVRKDSFEAWVRDDYADPYFERQTMATEEDIRKLTEMAESAVLSDNNIGRNPVWKIVTEESEMYFAGDADLDSTVQKIQTRVQLYLDEL